MLNVAITLSSSNDSKVELENGALDGEIYITIQEGRTELSAKVDTEELRLAIRKITAK